jgi:hypothetical protein
VTHRDGERPNAPPDLSGGHDRSRDLDGGDLAEEPEREVQVLWRRPPGLRPPGADVELPVHLPLQRADTCSQLGI